MRPTPLELVCPAGSLPAFRAALDAGADAIYLGFRGQTNARAFAGLNFTEDDIRKAVALAHARNTRVFLAINTYAEPGNARPWERAVDAAADLGIDALILADAGLMAYARQRHPDLRLHLSVQGSVTTPEALNFLAQRYGISRAVLPRVLSLQQVTRVASLSGVEIEVFGFGSLCIMAEGRCHLSSWMTGESPNTCGVCSPARHVRWEEQANGRLQTRLNGYLVDDYAAGEHAAYPTLCKGRFVVDDQTYHALEEPTSLNTLDVLPDLFRAGVKAIKIEGRQRSPAYVRQVTGIWRAAIDKVLEDPDRFTIHQAWQDALTQLSEGAMTTLGAYHRSWQ
jgi:putative protease